MKYRTALLSLLLALAIATPADAFRPRNPTRPRSASSTAAVRGSCTPGESLSVTAIAPRTITGSTLDNRPTLYWYVPDAESYEMDLNWYEYDYSDEASGQEKAVAEKKTWKSRETMQTQQGLMQWRVPEALKLEPGKRYLWEVVLYCNPNRPSEIAETGAEIKLESVPVGLKAMVDNTPDPIRRADLYAEAGFWYEAFEQVAVADTPAVVAKRQALIRALLAVESEVFGVDPASMTPEQLLIRPELDSPLVRLAKRATRQLMAIVELKI